MSDEDGWIIFGGVLCVVLTVGVFLGFLVANWQHEYVSDDIVVKFRMAENITSNMTPKEKIELIKMACEDNYQRDACYEKMYDIFINQNKGE